jgi:hypothetical protein
MNIRARLKQNAEVQLQSLVEKLERHAINLCGDLPIEPKELCRMVCSERTTVLTRKLTSRMAQEAEKQMVADYEDRHRPHEDY